MTREYVRTYAQLSRIQEKLNTGTVVNVAADDLGFMIEWEDGTALEIVSDGRRARAMLVDVRPKGRE